jgi:hypothetical protein
MEAVNEHIKYIVEEHHWPDGWAVYRQTEYHPGESMGHRVAVYREQHMARRVANFLNAVRDQGAEIDDE